MRVVLCFCLLLPLTIVAQGLDNLTVTLPTGKVITFQTAEQKEKYLAARARVTQSGLSNQASAQTPAPQPTASTSGNPWDLNKVPATSPHPYFFMDAVKLGATGQTDYEFKTDYGSYIANRTTASHIEIAARNGGKAPGALRARWFFFSDVAGRYIVGGGQRDLILSPNQEEKWDPGKGGSEHVVNLVMIGDYSREGTQVNAWLVQFFTAPDKIEKQIASSGVIEQRAADLKQFDEQVQEFEHRAGKLPDVW